MHATITAIYCPFQCNDYVCIHSKQLQKSKFPITVFSSAYTDGHNTYPLLHPFFFSPLLKRNTLYQTRDLWEHPLLTTLHTLLTRSPRAVVQGALTTSAGKQTHFHPASPMSYQKPSHHSAHLSPKMLLKSRHSCSHSM